MNNILFINACVRQHSRTFALAKHVLEQLDGTCQEVHLPTESMQPLDAASLEKREQMIARHDFSDATFRFAKDFAAADTVVVAAPYWDLSFPALLKIYLEQIAVCGLTFEYQKGVPHSLCQAKKLIYVTTAGGTIYFNFGFEYVKALAETFFSIPDVLCFTAEGLDIKGADVDKIMAEAMGTVERALIQCLS